MTEAWADVRFEAADITGAELADAFARSATDTWGTADPLGLPYTSTGGGSLDPSDFQVADGVGTQSVPVANGWRLSYLAGLDLADVDVMVRCTLGVAVTGAAAEPANIYLRGQDLSNYYLFRLEVSPVGQAVTAVIYATGGPGELARVGTIVEHEPGVPMWVRAYARGRLLRMKVWQGDLSDQPDAWALEVADATFASGWVGVRSGLAFGNTNTKPVEFAYDDLYITEVWTDLSERVLAPEASGGQDVLVTSGRQTEHQDTEPSRLSLSLKNSDGELTPRNPLSVYPGWGPDVLVRLSDLITGTALPLFQGYTEVSEVTIDLDGVDQPAQVSAVDLLGKLGSARSFVSNLGEHVIDAGRNRGLVAYWPCDDSSLPLRSAISSEVLEERITESSFDIGSEQVARVEFGSGTARPVDDISPIKIVTALDTAGTATARSVLLRAVGPQGYQEGTQTLWRVLPGQVMTAVMWIDIDLSRGESVRWYSGSFSEGPGGDVRLLFGDYDVSTGTFGVGVPLGDLTGSVSTDAVATIYAQRDSAAFPIALRFGFDPAVLELWIDRERYVGSLAGTAGYDELILLDGHVGFAGLGFDGTLAHCQLYIGGPNDYTFDHFLAQKAYGALDRQTAAQRVETIVRYATGTTADVDVPAAAATPLRQARLAGSSPADQLRTAARTEQGILTTKATGEITLVPRGQRYGQTAAMEIPYTWLARGLSYREDRPVRDVAVAAAGGTARRTNPAVTAVSSLSYSLDSAVPGDAGNLAQWTIDAYGRARTRCPTIAVDLHSPRLADVQRAALLGLVEGDRITVTGRPERAPADAADLIVLGREHRISGDVRRLLLRTGPMLGPSDGVPPVGAVVTESTAAARTWSFVGVGAAASDGNASGAASLSPALPAGWQPGDLLLLLDSIRNSGTGTVNTPSGWLSFFSGTSNRDMAMRVAQAGDSAPTVTFNGGVANATVIAQVAAFRPSIALPELTSAFQLTGDNGIATQLNASAQNIAYPGLTVVRDNALILYFGWKQDDWTSVSGPGTEIGEPDETAGDDAGQVWNYQIQTSAANISAGSWTVTGGVSAISRGGVAALYPGWAGTRVDESTLIGY